MKKAIETVDLKLLEYMVENGCTDGTLKRAIEVYTVKYEHDEQLVFVSSILVILSVGCNIAIILIKNKCFKDRLHFQLQDDENGVPN